MNFYKVEIKTPNQIFIHRGKVARSPVIYKDVTKQELLILKTQALKNNSEIYYNIQEVVVPTNVENLTVEEKISVIEEINYNISNDSEKESTILEKLLRGENIE